MIDNIQIKGLSIESGDAVYETTFTAGNLQLKGIAVENAQAEYDSTFTIGNLQINGISTEYNKGNAAAQIVRRR